jgi:hypothetical protein
MANDFALAMTKDLSSISSLQDFCKEWTSRWKAVAIAAQAILKIFFPVGAEVLGFLIGIADSFCASSSKSK